MKKITLFILLGLALTACEVGTAKNQQQAGTDPAKEQALALLKDSSQFTSIEWLDSTFLDMGKVVKGQTLDVEFRFRNAGDKPLIISSVTASCGCTVPETPKEPFAPGAEGVIKAQFNSSSQSFGVHSKSVYVTANTKPSTYTVLDFKADVVEK